jgi:hypothetical protein
MQTPREILADLWTLAGGDPLALDAVTLTGKEPQLPSSFRVAAAAQASIAASGLAAAQIWKLRSGQSQHVAVDMRHAVVECRSERYLRVDGKPPGPAWDAIAGIYKTRDRRFVRLHTNFPHHRDAVCKVLNSRLGLPGGVRRDDGAGAPIARGRQLACPRVLGADRAVAVESGPRGRWSHERGFEGRNGWPVCGRATFRLRFAALRQPFGRAVENTGILGAPGDAARQSPAAMAGPQLRSNADVSKKAYVQN